MGITVLSLFDGISCGQIALERAGIKVDRYYASEIKKCAIETTMRNYPGTIQIGDVRKAWYNDGILHTENGDFNVGKIDLLIGGSPCQNFSIARVSMGTKEIEGLNGEKSRLFYEYLRLKRTIEPEFFLLENVKMKKKDEEELNKYIGVNGIHINSKLVSYQLRDRIYWSNIKGITEPEDRKINFQDYKDTDEKYCSEFKVKRTPSRERMWNEGRAALRISSTSEKITEEINDCIAACKADLKNDGVKVIKETDELIIRAITLYCKAEFGFNNNAEQFRKSYDALKMRLALSVEYNTAPEVSETDTDGAESEV